MASATLLLRGEFIMRSGTDVKPLFTQPARHLRTAGTFAMAFLLATGLVLPLANNEGLHGALDASSTVLSVLLTLIFMSEHREGITRPLRTGLWVGLGLTSIGDAFHALGNLDWGASTWLPSVYVLPVSLAWALKSRAARPAIFLVTLSTLAVGLTFVTFSYPHETTSLALEYIPAALLWLWVIRACRSSGEPEGVAWMGAFLFVATLCSSLAPHEGGALGLVAHVGKLFAFGLLLFIQSGAAESASSEASLRAHIDKLQRELDELNRIKFALDQHAILGITDAAGTITTINDKFVELSGFQAHELIGSNHRILNSGVHPPEFFANLYQTITSGNIWRGEICNKTKDGHLYWVTTTIVPFLANEHRPTSYVAVRTDITQLKRAEAAEQAAAARYRAATLSKLHAFVTADAKGDIVGWNPGAEATFGYAETEIIGKPFDSLLSSRSREGLERDVKGLTAEEALQAMGKTVEIRGRSRDGREFPMEMSLSEWETSEGHFVTGIMLDISKRRATEDRLRHLSQAIEQSSENIVITDLEGRIEYVNDTFVRSTGYARSQVIGQNPRFLKSGKTPPPTFASLWANLSKGLAWKGEFSNCRKDGSVYIEFTVVSPIRQQDGTVTHYVSVGDDITDKKRMGEELTQHRKNLEELVTSRTEQLAEARTVAETANRAKSVFLANMSHEIRTPMNAIIGLTHLLRRNNPTQEQLVRLTKIDAAASHLLTIINDILDISKIEAGKLLLEDIDFSLVTVLENVRALVGDQAESKGLALEFDIGDVPHWLRGDPTRVRQALVNYIGNALKFTEYGSIVLRVRMLEDNGDRLLLRFEVQDSGIGIPPEKLGSLFQNFEQADASTTRRFGGTGLGLAITRRVAVLMGGDAGVESAVGIGSTFWFTARIGRGQGPMVDTSNQTVRAEVALQQRRRPSRVLLVDDSDINREVARELLEGVGLIVDTAENGRQAIEKVHTQTYALILMDLQMPELDGIEATRAIRAIKGLPRIPILAMTANVFAEDRRACIEAGMNEFVSKPVDPDLLFAAVLKWLPMNESSPSALLREIAPPPIVTEVHPAYPGLDVRHGLTLWRRAEPFRKFLGRFAADYAESAKTIQQKVAANERGAAAALAHTMRGAAGNLALTDIARSATELERLLKQGGEVTGALADLQQALDVGLNSIANYLKE